MTIITIILTVLMLSVLIVVHEWGHFIAARKVGVLVEEFSIGMGPAIFKHQGKETLFSVRVFLLGGYCKMLGEGENPEAEEVEETQEESISHDTSDDPRSFLNKTKGQRLIILVAGAAMNILFGFLCIVLVFLFKGANPLQAVGNAFLTTGEFAVTIYKSLYLLVSGQVGMNEMAGPIGMVSMVGSFLKYGAVALLSFTALISINLGVMNLLPLPALDGGQIAIILIEKLVGHDLPPEKANLINYIGFIALMFLAVVIAVNDVLRIAG